MSAGCSWPCTLQPCSAEGPIGEGVAIASEGAASCIRPTRRGGEGALDAMHGLSMLQAWCCAYCAPAVGGRRDRDQRHSWRWGKQDSVADGHVEAVRAERGGVVEGRGVAWGSPGHTSVDHLPDKRSVGWLHTRRVAHRRDDGRRRRSEVLLDVRDGRLARLQHPTCNTR